MSESFAVQAMLAASEIPTYSQLNLHKTPYMFSVKYDGIRALLHKGVAKSRTWTDLPNKYIQQWADKYANYLQGLDGEILVGKAESQLAMYNTSSGVMSREGAPDFKLYVFDVWDEPEVDALDRQFMLKARTSHMPSELLSRIVLVEQTILTNEPDLNALYDGAVDMGYEGLIGKRADGHYKYGRSTLSEGLLLKFKRFADSEIRVEDIIQGEKNANENIGNAFGKTKRSTAKGGKVPMDTIGSFIGTDINPASPYFQKKVKVGPGVFKKDILAMLYKLHQEWLLNPQNYKKKPPVLGRILTYKYQVSGAKDKPRYPGAKAFRDPMDL